MEKAEDEFKAKTKSSAFDKTVNYGNGVSIDTDDVVYIEYGPYHTYTFKINRENATAEAPVENLILSLEPDGSYKELLKTYHLTQNDRHELSLGNGIDLDGKTTTVELAKGTYHQALGKMTPAGCYYQSQQVYQACCHGVHGEGNIGEWGSCTCTGAGLPKMYTIEIVVCDQVPGPPTGGWTPNPSSPSAPIGGGSTEGGSTGVGSATTPTDPNTVEGAQGQLGGMPTLPILEFNPIKTPCEKIKTIGKQTRTKALFENLKTKTNSTKEFGELLQENNGQVDNASIEGEIGQAGISFNINGQIDGFLHSHYVGLLSVFSPADLATLSGLYKNGNIKDPDTFVLGLVTASNTQYMIVIDDLTKFNIFAGEFITADGQINYDYIETYTRWNYAQYNILYNNLSSVNELGFVKFLLDKNSGLKVLKGSNNSNTWEELRIKDGKIDPVPCN